MSLSSVSTIVAATRNKNNIIPLPNYFYTFNNSSDLSGGYIKNYSIGTYDLAAVNITTSNFKTTPINGIFYLQHHLHIAF